MVSGLTSLSMRMFKLYTLYTRRKVDLPKGLTQQKYGDIKCHYLVEVVTTRFLVCEMSSVAKNIYIFCCFSQGTSTP